MQRHLSNLNIELNVRLSARRSPRQSHFDCLPVRQAVFCMQGSMVKIGISYNQIGCWY